MRRYISVLLICGFALTGATAAAAEKVAYAGAAPNQRVESGDRVALRGSGWSSVGRVVRFAWVQVDGPTVRLRDGNRSTANFVSPEVTKATVLKFQLTVTDIRGNRDSSIMAVTVQPKKKPGESDSPPN